MNKVVDRQLLYYIVIPMSRVFIYYVLISGLEGKADILLCLRKNIITARDKAL